MRLTIATPMSLVVEVDEITHVRAQDDSGAFGILQGHADFLTALAVSVLIWRDAQHQQHYVAVRGGMLSVRGGDTVWVATPEAVVGEGLLQLESNVLARFRRELEDERASRTDAERLRLAAIRQLVRLLRPEQPRAPTLGG